MLNLPVLGVGLTTLRLGSKADPHSLWDTYSVLWQGYSHSQNQQLDTSLQLYASPDLAVLDWREVVGRAVSHKDETGQQSERALDEPVG